MIRVTFESTPEPGPFVVQGSTPFPGPMDGDPVAPGVPEDFVFPPWVDVKKFDPATLFAIFQLIQQGLEMVAKIIAFFRERRAARR